MLFDQFGRKIDYSRIKKADTRVIPVVALEDRYSGYPSSGLTPRKLGRIFREADSGDTARQAELFSEMEEKDTHLFSQLLVRKQSVQALEWEVEASEKNGKARETARAVRDFLESYTNSDEVVLDLMDAVAKGYSMCQIIWDNSEKQTSVLDIKWVRADRVTFWNSLTPRVLTVDEPVQGIDLPPYKFIYHRYKARSGDDMRAGILRPVSWMFVFKNYSVKDWVAFAEIYGQPLRLGKYDPGASDEEKDALVLAVQSIGTDAAGIISRKTEIEFKDTVARNSTENVYSGLAGFCDRQMSKAILGQTLTSESGDKGSGSYALGSVHDRVRFDLKNSDASSLSKTFRSQFVRPFVGYNFGWDAPVPKYRLICEKPEDLEKIGKIYQVVTDIGLDVSQEHVSERFQIPMRKRGETPLLTMQQQPIPVENTLKMIPENTLKMKTGNPHADLEEMSFQASENTFSAFEEDILKPVLGMLEGVETYEEAGELLYEMFSDLDMRAFEELLTRSVLAAGLSGYGASCDDAAE